MSGKRTRRPSGMKKQGVSTAQWWCRVLVSDSIMWAHTFPFTSQGNLGIYFTSLSILIFFFFNANVTYFRWLLGLNTKNVKYLDLCSKCSTNTSFYPPPPSTPSIFQARLLTGSHPERLIPPFGAPPAAKSF